MSGETADAVVIGAGVAGAGAARGLAERGFATLLIDAGAPGGRASGANPGFLWMQTKAVGPALALALHARAAMERIAGEIGDFGFRPSGGLILIRDPGLVGLAHRFVADRIAAGLTVAWLDREETRACLPAVGPGVVGALHCPLDAHQDTRALVRALIARALDRGARLAAGRPVAAIETRGGRVAGVRLADGARIAAPVVVLAAGAGAKALAGTLGLALPLTPTRFEAFETAPAAPVLGPVVCGQSVLRLAPWSAADRAAAEAALDAAGVPRGFTEQVAQFPDGRIRGGCAFVIGSEDPRPGLAGLGLAGTHLPRDLPMLAGVAVERIWGEIVAAPADGLPVIDADAGPEGLILDCGHFFGNLAGAPAGEIVAALAAGEAPPIDLAP